MVHSRWTRPQAPQHLNQEQRDGLACVQCGQQSREMQPVEAWSGRFRTELLECIDQIACADPLGDRPPGGMP